MTKTGALEDDILGRIQKFLETLTVGIGGYITRLTCGLFAIMIAISFLVLVTNSDVAFWKQYSPLVFGASAVLVCYATIIASEETFMVIFDGILPKLKSYLDLDQKNFKVIKFEAKVAEYWVIVSVTTIMLTTVICLPFYGDEYDVVLPVKLSIDYLGKFGIFLKFFFFGHFFYGGNLMVGDGVAMLYVSLHLKFQLYILRTELVRMEKTCQSIDDHQLIENEEFQKEVFRNLIACIKHHQLITILNQEINKLVRFPIFGFTISGIVSFVSITVSIYSFDSLPVNPNGNIRILMIGAFAVLITGAFIYSGQSLINECERVYECIKNLPWYHYNTKNRILLLNFLQKTQNPLNLSSSGIITINNVLVIRLYRNIYSFFTFLSSAKW